MKIGHGSSLILRNVEWKVAKKDISVLIIGRGVSESLGCSNWEMLMGACDKYGEYNDVSQRLAKDSDEEEIQARIAALFGESAFHRG